MAGTMPDRLQSYRNHVSDTVDAWQANVCTPYIIAYNTAYKSYIDLFKKQSESDKARAYDSLRATPIDALPSSRDYPHGNTDPSRGPCGWFGKSDAGQSG